MNETTFVSLQRPSRFSAARITPPSTQTCSDARRFQQFVTLVPTAAPLDGGLHVGTCVLPNPLDGRASAMAHEELWREIERAGKAYGFWPGVLEPWSLISFNDLPPEERSKDYARIAAGQRTSLARLENENLCSSLVSGFGSAACARIFFESPWVNRIRKCTDYVEVAKTVWTMSATSWAYAISGWAFSALIQSKAYG
jgi:hypothetical protein